MGAKDEKTEDIELHRNGKFARDFSFIELKLKKRQSWSQEDKIYGAVCCVGWHTCLLFSGLVLIYTGLIYENKKKILKFIHASYFIVHFFPEQDKVIN